MQDNADQEATNNVIKFIRMTKKELEENYLEGKCISLFRGYFIVESERVRRKE